MNLGTIRLGVFLMSATLLLNGSENFSHSTTLQNDKTEFVYISYAQQLQNFDIEEDIDWKLYNKENDLLKQGSGSKGIQSYVFSIPGTYTIQIFEKRQPGHHVCNHSHYPAKIIVEVSPYRLEFDFSTITFSSPIIGDIQTDGIRLGVMAKFSSYNNTGIVLENLIVRTEGVGTSVQGLLQHSNTALKPGLNKLVYVLSGTATRDSYIGFCFLNIQKQVVVYSYPYKIW